MDKALLERFQQKDRQALARLLSLVHHGETVDNALEGTPFPSWNKATLTIGVTGSGGVGKSTFIGKLIERVRTEGKTVGVLACDPQSPITGGALLGDRFRMPSRPDDGVFIRSIATQSRLGAVAKNLDRMVALLKAFGFDVVIIETVGAGQGDINIRDLVDLLVLLVQPETGDDIQWEKAGLFEVADLIVVHKGDLPGADQVEAHIRSSLHLGTASSVPVFRISSQKGDGWESFWKTLWELSATVSRRHESFQSLLRQVQDQLADWYHLMMEQKDPEFTALLHDWEEGKLDGAKAMSKVFRLWEKSLLPSAHGT